MEWDAKYSVGVDYLDNQHKKIIDYINNVEKMAQTAAAGIEVPTAKILEQVDLLAQYTQSHFADEELLMSRHNMVDLSRHKAIHKNLINQVNTLRGKVNSHGAAVLPILVKFLNEWLQTHILGVDNIYTSIIGRRESP